MMTDKKKMEIIEAVVSGYYGLKEGFFAKTRKRKYVEPRQKFHFLCRFFTELSLDDIAKFKDTRPLDHSSVYHGIQKVAGMIEVDKAEAKEVNELIRSCDFTIELAAKSLSINKHLHDLKNDLAEVRDFHTFKKVLQNHLQLLE